MNSNYFQQLAEKYDSWFKTPHGRYVQRFEEEMIMSLTNIKPGMYIADIGCGTGIYTRKLCSYGAKVVGIDISPEMLLIAEEKSKEYADQVEFLQGDASRLPFKDSIFDGVFSITAMEFFDDPRPCLHEMYRILRPGGHMIVATLNRLSIWAFQRRLKSWFANTIFSHAYFYSINDIRRILYPYTVTKWQGGIFIPPFAPNWMINNPDTFEKWGQRYIPQFGSFVVVRIDK